MQIPDSFIQEVIDRNEISDVVGGYVKLTKHSGANIFGICPFHSEKTPSFSVSPDKQIFYCFGCHKGGSVINFIMEIENLGYIDAVQFLAQRAGLQMPEDGNSSERHARERMLELNREAARFYFSCLSQNRGAKARAYIQNRGISPTMVKTFGIGCAPDEWDALQNEMLKRGFTTKELFDARLIKSRQNGKGYYDTFRNRLMFPVIDIRGNVIGFSGRLLDGEGPKYMNSPETPVFSKSRNLFALNLAKKSKKGYIILTEGNIDVVSLHQSGFDCAVASLGTALTPEQARLISRYVNEVIIAYDSDEAGRKASARAVGILEKLDISVRILKLQDAKDPDEFIKTKGVDAFANLIEKSENHVEYSLAQIAAKYDITQDEQRVAYLKEASASVAELSSSVEREVYAMRIAEKSAISSAVVLDEISRIRAAKLRGAKKQYERQNLNVMATHQPRDRAIRYENEQSAIAEEGVIRLLYSDPSLIRGRKLSREDFTSELLGRFFQKILEKSEGGAQPNLASFGDEFTAGEISHLTTIIQAPELMSNSQKALDDYIDRINIERQNPSGADDSLRSYAQQLRERKGYGGKHE